MARILLRPTARFEHERVCSKRKLQPYTPQPSLYVVDGLALGSHVVFQSEAYKQYHCTPSDKFSTFTWCHKEKTEKTKRGEVTSSNSILHNQDGTAVYVNRYIEPAFFDPNDVRSEIDRLSAKFGERAREFRMPSRAGLPDAIIAVWGKIELEQLGASDVSTVASGGSVKGLLVSFLGDLQRSAKAGVPVYRLAGGAGFFWAATFNQDGRGVLRFLTIDASEISPSPQVASPSPTSAATPSFNCANATYPDERAICSSTELSQLDTVLVAGYEYVRSRYGDQYAKSINAPLFQARRACGSDVACIKERQLTAIKTFEGLGAPIPTLSERTDNQTAASNENEEAKRKIAEAEAAKRAADELNFPALTGAVVDQAELLDASARAVLTKKLMTFEAKSTDQLVVVTLTSLQGASIEDFGLKLFNYWRLGQKNKNSGVLLLVAPNERKVRIEVGYGLESTLTNATASNIIEGSIIPQFRANDFPGGIARGVEAIIKVLSEASTLANYAADQGAEPMPAKLPEEPAQRPDCEQLIVSKPYFMAACIARGMETSRHLDGLSEAKMAAERERNSLADCAPNSVIRLRQMAELSAAKILNSGSITQLMDFSDAMKLECNKAAGLIFTESSSKGK